MRYPAFLLALAAGSANAQSIDSFNPAPVVPPTTLALQADGKIILAGNFLQVGITPRERIARLNHDGSLDSTFQDPGINGEIKSVAIQADGKILIGGGFDAIGTDTRHYLARLNADGSFDSSFGDAGSDSEVWAIAVQPDGKILAAGDFTHIGATAQKYFARVSAAGAFDSSFADPQLCCIGARSLALQADGHVLIGGYFSQAGGVSHFYFARYSSSGAFDSSFPGGSASPQPAGIVVAPDGSIFISDTGSDSILKYSATGTPIAAYTSAAADSTINSFVLQPNGKIVIGGIFENVGSQPHHALARLNADGTLDGSFADLHFSFSPTDAHGYIYGVAAQTDGDAVAIGNFPLADNLSRQYVARVVTGDARSSTLTGQPSGSNVIVTWTRTGDGPELAQAPVLMHSTDGVNYTAVGAMTHIVNGWQETAPYNIAGAPFYLKATGFSSGGAGNGSPGSVDSPVYVSDRIFADGFE